MLISFAVTAKLICAFVFAYANFWFSRAKAHIPSVGILRNNENHNKTGIQFNENYILK